MADAASFEQIRIAHWNVNSDRRIQNKGRFYTTYASVYGVETRWPRIASVLDSLSAEKDVISLFEVDQTEMLPRIAVYWNAKDKDGWQWHYEPYNLDEGCMVYVLAWRGCVDVKFDVDPHFALTTSGKFLTGEQRATMSKTEQIAHGLDQQFEKSIVGYVLRAKSSPGKVLELWQMHLGLSNLHRELACAKIANFISARRKACPDVPIMLAGDDNGFDLGDPTVQYNAKMRQMLFHSSATHGDATPFEAPVYYSTVSLAVRDTTDEGLSSFRAFDFDIARFLTPEDKVEEDALLDDPEGMRALHRRVISRENAKLKLTCIGMDEHFKHWTIPDIRYSVVMDEAYVWAERTKALVEAELLEHYDASDHASDENFISR